MKKKQQPKKNERKKSNNQESNLSGRQQKIFIYFHFEHKLVISFQLQFSHFLKWEKDLSLTNYIN